MAYCSTGREAMSDVRMVYNQPVLIDMNIVIASKAKQSK